MRAAAGCQLAHGGRQQLTVLASLAQGRPPPGEVVEHDPAAVAAAGSRGAPCWSKAFSTRGISTLLRNGTISASTAICARCSMARTPAEMPPL